MPIFHACFKSDMKRYRVKEGNTGVLELVDEQGRTEIYQPDCDIDKARDLLYEFYECETTTGTKVTDAFQKEDMDWFPTAVSFVHWQIFYQFVKYRPLVQSYFDGDMQFKFESSGRFLNLIKAIDTSNKQDTGSIRALFKKVYHGFIQIRNRIIVKKEGDIFFFRYGISDFRTAELLQSLRKRFQVTQVVNAPVKEIFKHFFDPQLYILTAAKPGSEFTVTLPEGSAPIFKTAINSVKTVINGHLSGYNSHSRVMQKLHYQLFFGIDDTSIIYPLLYSAQDAGMKSLGIQHGIYTRLHEAYIMNGIERYRWFDNVLVWGEYWKKIILRSSSMFEEGFHMLASHETSYSYDILPKNGKVKTILVPYEFLADSIKIGQYIRKFIDKGFEVYFKTRPDERIEDQIHSYYLGDMREKLHIIDTIGPDVMSRIDVVAGTYSTMLFDLLPYGKPIWILDTPFHLMYEMVEDGFARLIKEEDMDRIDDIYKEDIRRKQVVDLNYFSDKKPVTEAIEEYLTASIALKGQ